MTTVNTNYIAAFNTTFNKAPQHFGTAKTLEKVLKERMEENRYETFGIPHAVTEESGRRVLLIPGVQGTVVFTEDGVLEMQGDYADRNGPVYDVRYWNALVTLMTGGYPIQFLLDIMDYQCAAIPLPRNLNTTRFFELVENF